VPLNYCYFIAHVQIQPQVTIGVVLSVTTAIQFYPLQLPFSSIRYNCHTVLSITTAIQFYPLQCRTVLSVTTAIQFYPLQLTYSFIRYNCHTVLSVTTSIQFYPLQLPYSSIRYNCHTVLSVTTAIQFYPLQLPHAVMQCRRTSLSLYSYLYHYNYVSVIGCLQKQLRERGWCTERTFTLTLSTLRHIHRRFLIVDRLVTWKHVLNKWINKLCITTVLSNVYCIMCYMFRPVCNPLSGTG
jgi:hypothetical protein